MTEGKKLSDKYDAKIREKFWQNYWRGKKIFAWKNDLPKEKTFVIDTPPPTVSGVLHMGHVFSYTQADFVARFMRMSGKDVFYPMGFDDNGLPTERLVEKIIGKKAGIFESENGHGSFVKKCREVVDEAEKEFEALFNEVALSVDWEQKYQTISPESQKISQASFIDLHRKGLVEKKFEPVFWDISDRTALAQADLIDKEIAGEMNYISFGIEGSDEKLEIMTTRPELLPACVAVMINPDHKNEDGSLKWAKLLKNSLNSEGEGFTGSYAVTPLFGVKVKIIADKLVQTDKGTGAVMCCTFGDETDIRWWKKYNLELRVIIEKGGKLNDFVGDWSENFGEQTVHLDDLQIVKFTNCDLVNPLVFKKNYNELVAGKTIKQAKEAIIEALKTTCHPECSEGSQEVARDPSASPQDDRISLLRKQEKITRAVKCAERSGVPIEILVAPQWFVKILDKKEQLKAEAAKCNWHPEYMKVRIDQWIDGLQWDWCISRQRFFGVAFPVWYSKRVGEEGKILVAEIGQLPCDPTIDLPRGYSRDEVDPETDIMDTWMTSSISPQLSSKGISDEICFDRTRHEKLFSADLRPQAHEIIRTWAFYTIAKAYLHSLPLPSSAPHPNPLPQGEREVSYPWKNLMISGWCLAADKTKMSKSKGNVITPTALIEEKGSDIVRYWASTSHLGADTAYSEDVFKIGQKLITKLFNAAKFASMNFSELRNDAKVTEAADLWILSKLHLTTKRATEEFEKFEYARAREAIEEFFWKDFCDNYLEICKVRSYGLVAEKLVGIEFSDAQKKEIHAKQQSSILTLQTCLNTILKLFAPFIPHVTEEIYSTIFCEEFEKTDSINARGSWPKLGEKFFDQKFFDIGEAALRVIFEVRKFKSEQNLSMKTTVKKIAARCKTDLSEITEDLKNVCNVEVLELSAGELLVNVEIA